MIIKNSYGSFGHIWASLPLALFSLAISLPLAADCWVSVHKGAISPVADSPFQPRNIYRAWRICLAILVTTLLCYPQPSTADCWGTYSAVTGEYSPPMPTAEAALSWVTERYENYYLGKMYCIYHPSPNEDVHEPIASFSYTDSVIDTSQPGIRWSSGIDQGVGIPVAYKRTINSYSARGGLCSNWPYVGTNNYSYYDGGYLSGDPSCKPSSYVIKLTRYDGLSESGTVLTDIEPAKLSLLVARVYDQTGQPVLNAGLKLSVDVEAYSGGHNHDDAIRQNQHMGKLAPAGTTQATVDGNGKALTGSTGSNGLEFSFTAPAISGVHTITAKCTDSSVTCTQEGPYRIFVRVKSLIWQTNSPNYVLMPNRDANHPGNHYVTTNTGRNVANLAAAYHEEFPTDPVLHFNDASLEWGGLFDIDRNWRLPHETHRFGANVDVKANEFYHEPSQSIPTSNYIDFWNMGRYYGCYVALHSGATPNEHFHLYCP